MTLCLALLLGVSTLVFAPSMLKTQSANAADCKDVLLLGARGSSQTDDPAVYRGLGQQVRDLFDILTPRLEGSGRSVEEKTVAASEGYWATGVHSIFNPSIGLWGYLGGITEGKEAVIRILRERSKEGAPCPQQRIVLAGYSQGAMVMHRALRDMYKYGSDADRTILTRVDGVVLLADGNRSEDPNVQLYGTAGPRGYGIDRIRGTHPVPEKFAGRVHSVCAKGDVVCDTSYWTEGINGAIFFTVSKLTNVLIALSGPSTAGAAIHLGKTYKAGSTYLEAVAKNVYYRVISNRAPYTAPAPKVTTPYLPDGLVNVAYYLRLAVSGGALPLKWSVTGLPAGLKLEGEVITGTPTSAGASTVTLSVTDGIGRRSERTLPVTVKAASTESVALLGKIAREPNGTSWYVDKRGGRHWVPDGGTYDCLVAQGVVKVDAASDAVLALPKYENAQCVRAQTGNIIRHSNGDSYLLNGNWTRSWIPDGDTYNCLTANGRAVVNAVPRYYIDDLTQAANVTYACYDATAVKGKVVRGSDGASWYVDKRGGKHWIPDGGTYECIAAQTGGAWPYVVPAGRLTQPKYEDAKCVRANAGDIIKHDNGDSYVVNGNWSRSWIPDGNMYTCFTVNGRAVVSGVPRYYIDDLPQAANASFSCYDAAGVKGKVVRGSDGKSWYVDKRGGKHWIPDGGTYECVAAQTGGAWPHVVPATWLTQPTYENAQCVRAVPGNVIRHTNGDAYVVNGNWTRGWIPTASSWTCYRAEGRTLVDGVPRYYIDDLTQAGNAVYGNGNCIIRQPDGTAWYVNNEGNREWIPDSPTWDCEVGRGTPVVNTTAAFAAGVGEKGWHYCLNMGNLQNKIVRNADTGASWLTNGSNVKTWIPDEFTYNCRVRQGYPVVNTKWQQYIDAFSGGTWDSCFDIETFKNKFIKMDPDGDAYFVDGAGVRHWVPAGAYNCMVGRFGQPHITKRRNYIDAIPAGDWAVCGDTLYPNQNMDRGQWLSSSNGYKLIMQYDGNLVLYAPSGGAVWASNTAGSSARKARFDANGAVSVQDGSGNWLRSLCGTWGTNATNLVVQTDGNLVLYRNGTPIWARYSNGLC